MKLIKFSYVCLLIVSCTEASIFSFYKNERIPLESRNEINGITDSIFNCFISNNFVYLFKIADSGFVTKFRGTERILSELKYKNDRKRLVLDQYLINCTPSHQLSNVFSKGDISYNCFFYEEKKYEYIYFMCLPLTDNRSEWMITSVFSRERKNDRWRLSTLNCNFRRYDNRTAEDYYHQAKDEYMRSKIIESYLTVHVAFNLLNSLETGFHYAHEQEIKDFAEKVRKAVDSQKLLPFTIKKIQSAPQVYDVRTMFAHGKLLPLIVCSTKYDIKDSLHIKQECLEIGKCIKSYFPNIQTINDSVIYQFVNMEDSVTAKPGSFIFFASNK